MGRSTQNAVRMKSQDGCAAVERAERDAPLSAARFNPLTARTGFSGMEDS